jgi:hypothetical protein
MDCGSPAAAFRSADLLHAEQCNCFIRNLTKSRIEE